MTDMFRGLGLGYGSSAAAGAALFLACSCALAAIATFWLGGAAAGLGLTTLFWSRRERRRRGAI